MRQLIMNHRSARFIGQTRCPPRSGVGPAVLSLRARRTFGLVGRQERIGRPDRVCAIFTPCIPPLGRWTRQGPIQFPRVKHNEGTASADRPDPQPDRIECDSGGPRFFCCY